jgi:hypothetical protein
MSKNFLKLINSLLISLIGLSIAIPCLAAPLYNSDLQARITLDSSLKPDNSPGVIINVTGPGSEAAAGNYLLQLLAGALISIAAPVAIVIIAISGLFAVVSHGDQGMIDKAKKALTWAVIGLIVIIFSWVVIRTVVSLVLTANSNQNTQSTTQQKPTPAPTNGAGTGSASSGTDGVTL